MASFDYRITPAQHAAFERDGAVFLKSVVTGGLLDRLLVAVERAEDYEGGFWFKIYLWQFDPDFRDCCMASVVPGIAAQLLRTVMNPGLKPGDSMDSEHSRGGNMHNGMPDGWSLTRKNGHDLMHRP